MPALHEVTVAGCIAAPEPSNMSVGDDTARPKAGDAEVKLIEKVYLLLEVSVKVAEASSLVVSIGKQAFYTQIDLDTPKAYAYAKEVMSMNAMAADAQEGIGAFLGKRAPCWSGK